MSTSLGPLVRLEGITIQQLPAGGKPTEASSTASDLKIFITNVITEAVPFIDGVAPKAGGQSSWKKKASGKHFPSSEALVYSYERTVSGRELDKIAGMSQFSADRKDETWFCRRSCHRNAAEKGTASWEEFVYSFKEHHHESEDAFTPAVLGAREAMTWDTQGIEVEAHGGRWVDSSLKVVEMKHKIDPKPLKNRTFPVLQLSASLADIQEFIVVSIPITDFDKSPQAEYARDKRLVVASYSSIERIRVLPKSGETEWIMATASNAGGVLPQWLQNLAVPGKVAHDVDMFLAWIPSQRKTIAKGKGKAERATVTRSSTYDKSLPAAPALSETASMVTAPPPPISKEPLPQERPPVTGEESTNIILPPVSKEPLPQERPPVTGEESTNIVLPPVSKEAEAEERPAMTRQQSINKVLPPILKEPGAGERPSMTRQQSINKVLPPISNEPAAEERPALTREQSTNKVLPAAPVQ